jgi:hypothetical protein
MAHQSTTATQRVSITVNGERQTLDIEPRVSLADALRDDAGLLGVKLGTASAEPAPSSSTVPRSAPAFRWRSGSTAGRSRRSRAWRPARRSASCRTRSGATTPSSADSARPGS